MFSHNHQDNLSFDNTQAYLKTSLAMDMDDNNKKALKVASEKGFNTAATEMMKQAIGDYSRMRSMFG